MESAPYETTVRELYDATAKTYVAAANAIQGYYGLTRAFLARHATPGRRVLDVGCGPGHLTAGLDSSVHVTGIDISPAMIAEASKLRPAGRYECLSYNGDLPGLTGFDVVVAVGTLEFCLDLPAVLRRLAGATRSGGVLLVTIPERGRLVQGGDEAIRKIERRNGDVVPIHLFSLSEQAAAIDGAGLLALRYDSVRGWTDGGDREIPYAVWELARP